jgi:WD40 repeat protein
MARKLLIQEFRRLRGHDSYSAESLALIGRSQLHSSLSSLESACSFMNSSEGSPAVEKNVQRMLLRAQKDAVDAVSSAPDGISKALATKSAIAAAWYLNFDDPIVAKDLSISHIVNLKRQPEVMHAMSSGERSHAVYALLASIARISQTVNLQPPLSKMVPAERIVVGQRERTLHPVWDFLDWSSPPVILSSPAALTSDVSSSLRTINQLQQCGDYLCAACEDGTIDVFDLRPRIPHHVQLLNNHSGSVLCLSGHQQCLFSGSMDKTICVWIYKVCDDFVQFSCHVTSTES